MSDILVTSPFQPFTLPTQFKAVFNGYIYCGTVDAVDPSVSQVQVYLVNESGDKVPVAQPLRTNAGGYLVYNGQPAKFVTDSNHSLLVQDSFHSQVWYHPDVSSIDPQTAIGFIFSELAKSSGASLIGYGDETVDSALDGIFLKPSSSLLTIGGMKESQQLGFDLNGAQWSKDLLPVIPASFKNLDDYCLTSGVFEGQLEITVGPSGDFPSNGLNDAIAFASKFRPKYKNAGSNLHNRIDIKILSGVTVTEGINARGLDLSHIRLTSVDLVVPVTFDNGLWWMYGEWQCHLPIIATIFDMQGVGFDGASVKMGSQLVVEYGQGKECGIINAARHNIFGNTACNVVLREGVFTGAGGNGIHLEKGCTGCARDAKVSEATDHGVQLIASDLDIYGIDVSGAGQFAVLAQSGSVARGFGINGANCGSGLRADNGSKIVAPSSTLTGIGVANAIAIADELSEVDITGSTLSGGSAASLSLFGGKVVLGAMNCTNTGSASSNIRVLSGGLAFATGATGTTSVTPNTIQPNGIIFK